MNFLFNLSDWLTLTRLTQETKGKCGLYAKDRLGPYLYNYVIVGVVQRFGIKNCYFKFSRTIKAIRN